VKALASSCAIVADGSVKCWTLGSSSVQLIPGLTGPATAIADHSTASEVCVVVTDGSVECAGDNAFGRLGDGTTTSSGTFVKVKNLPAPALGVAVGVHFACAALTNQEAWCWGANDQGQLGLGTTGLPRPTPVKVGLVAL
jgi:alpha-tubulin suppressor-like RCC1 family protein